MIINVFVHSEIPPDKLLRMKIAQRWYPSLLGACEVMFIWIFIRNKLRTGKSELNLCPRICA